MVIEEVKLLDQYKKFTNLIFERKDSILIVKVNRPEVMNALNHDLFVQLGEAFELISEDHLTSVVILTGAGDKSFIAGADITMMKEFSCLDARKACYNHKEKLNSIHNCTKPTIAAINGYAFGGGLEVALCCDFRIAAETAKLSLPETKLAIIPGTGGTQRLPRLIGPERAKELIYTGKTIDANRAYKIGLVSRIVPLEQLISEALELANEIASNSNICVSLAKSAINTGIETDLETGLRLEAELFPQCFAADDCIEGLSAMLEKRKPNFLNK